MKTKCAPLLKQKPQFSFRFRTELLISFDKSIIFTSAAHGNYHVIMTGLTRVMIIKKMSPRSAEEAVDQKE